MYNIHVHIRIDSCVYKAPRSLCAAPAEQPPPRRASTAESDADHLLAGADSDTVLPTQTIRVRVPEHGVSRAAVLRIVAVVRGMCFTSFGTLILRERIRMFQNSHQVWGFETRVDGPSGLSRACNDKASIQIF